MEKRKRIFALLLALLLLAGCGAGSGKSAGPVPLTEEEIARVNEALLPYRVENGLGRSTEVSCFFTSRYDSVEDLDFEQFMRYFPSSELVLAQDEEEFAALAALPEFHWEGLVSPDGRPLSPDDLPVPTHRIREEAVNAALSKWAGITLDDIADKSGVLYLEDYHAFYTFTSDFGPGVFSCAGGEADVDTARLWSDRSNSPGQGLLTLERHDGNWHIRSFQAVSADFGNAVS